MSKNYLTNQSFHLSENKVRQIVQAELQEFFSCIKDEIENKIKQIDKNIIDLKSDIRKIQKSGPHQHDQLTQQIAQLFTKIQQIESSTRHEIERLADQIKSKAVDRSLQRRQDRSPLFRKMDAPALDLNNIIFGEQGIKATLSTANPQQKNQQEVKLTTISKPPLQKPKNEYKIPKIQPNERAKKQQMPVQPVEIEQSKAVIIDEGPIDEKVKENLNKNKNSFMRKKSLKKFSTITEEDVQQSIMSTS